MQSKKPKNKSFENCSSIEILADETNAIYMVKTVECVEDKGLVRFEKAEMRVPKNKLEPLVLEILAVARNNGK
jgi:hypothetical protein